MDYEISEVENLLSEEPKVNIVSELETAPEDVVKDSQYFALVGNYVRVNKAKTSLMTLTVIINEDIPSMITKYLEVLRFPFSCYIDFFFTTKSLKR